MGNNSELEHYHILDKAIKEKDKRLAWAFEPAKNIKNFNFNMTKYPAEIIENIEVDLSNNFYISRDGFTGKPFTDLYKDSIRRGLGTNNDFLSIKSIIRSIEEDNAIIYETYNNKYHAIVNNGHHRFFFLKMLHSLELLESSIIKIRTMQKYTIPEDELIISESVPYGKELSMFEKAKKIFKG